VEKPNCWLAKNNQHTNSSLKCCLETQTAPKYIWFNYFHFQFFFQFCKSVQILCLNSRDHTKSSPDLDTKDGLTLSTIVLFVEKLQQSQWIWQNHNTQISDFVKKKNKFNKHINALWFCHIHCGAICENFKIYFIFRLQNYNTLSWFCETKTIFFGGVWGSNPKLTYIMHYPYQMS